MFINPLNHFKNMNGTILHSVQALIFFCRMEKAVKKTGHGSLEKSLSLAGYKWAISINVYPALSLCPPRIYSRKGMFHC